MPIDINLLRVDAGGDPEKVKKSERDRFRDDSIVDQIIEIDNKWRKCKYIKDTNWIKSMMRNISIFSLPNFALNLDA